jgi:hypothetical protein
LKNLLNLVLALFLCQFSMNQAWASGSTTVYFQIGANDFTLQRSYELHDPYNQTENSEDTVLVATIDRATYTYIENRLQNRFKVYVQFEGLGFIRMYYDSDLDLIVGWTRDGSIILLRTQN